MTSSTSTRTGDLQGGITLIELLVVIVILGVLAAVAVPALDRYSMVARRSDARAALAAIAAQQAEFVLNHATYASSINALGLQSTSENGYYQLTVTANGSSAFAATATAAGTQTRDAECASFRITQTGAKTAKTSSNADSSAACW